MNPILRSFALAGVAAAMLVPTNAHADACSISAGSAETPHLVDFANDWDGVDHPVGLVPWGDIHREGTDLLDGWVTSTTSGSQTVYRANIEVAKLDGTQVSTTYGFWWTHDKGPAAQSRRYVQVSLNARGLPSYDFGYLDTSGSIGTITSQGNTTGTMTQGTPGVFSIVMPFNNPQLGKPSILDNPVMETRAQVGVLLGQADTSKDNGPCYQITFD